MGGPLFSVKRILSQTKTITPTIGDLALAWARKMPRCSNKLPPDLFELGCLFFVRIGERQIRNYPSRPTRNEELGQKELTTVEPAGRLDLGEFFIHGAVFSGE